MVFEWLLYVTFMPFEKKVFAFRTYVSLVGICFDMNDFFYNCGFFVFDCEVSLDCIL